VKIGGNVFGGWFSAGSGCRVSFERPANDHAGAGYPWRARWGAGAAASDKLVKRFNKLVKRFNKLVVRFNKLVEALDILVGSLNNLVGSLNNLVGSLNNLVEALDNLVGE